MAVAVVHADPDDQPELYRLIGLAFGDPRITGTTPLRPKFRWAYGVLVNIPHDPDYHIEGPDGRLPPAEYCIAINTLDLARSFAQDILAFVEELEARRREADNR